MKCLPQALEVRTPLFPRLVPPAIMVWIFVWKYIFEPFIHMLQHFMLQLSRFLGPAAVLLIYTTGARRQDPHMVPHVVVPPTNLFSFIFLFLIYFAWKIYGNTDKQVF